MGFIHKNKVIAFKAVYRYGFHFAFFLEFVHINDGNTFILSARHTATIFVEDSGFNSRKSKFI